MSLAIPSVSIIISAYERISYLPATIDSILQQSNSNFEVLVFSDSFTQIYPWFERQPDARLRFILQSNLGLADTYSQGILEARGKYISFIRTGDLWHPSKLQKQISCLDHYSHIGLIYTSSISIDRQNQSMDNWQEIETVGKESRIVCANPPQQQDNWGQPAEVLAHNRLPFSSVMLRRICFERVGLFDPEIQIIPDWEMWIRLNHHYEFMAISEPLVYSRQFQLGQCARWQSMETDLQIIIEKAYSLLPSEWEQQKHRSYSYASLLLAENVLQHKNPDPAIAHNYWYQALQHDSLIIFSSEFCRLRWVIFCLYCLQGDRYNSLLQLTRVAGDRCKTALYTLGEYGQKILNWMLEEEEGFSFWKNRKVNSTPPVKNGACVHFVKQQGKDI